MKKLLSGLVALASIAIVATASHAATLGPIVTSTPIPSTLTDWTSNLTFAQFNPALGTLVSVQLDLSGSLSTVITVTNSSPDSASNGTAKTEVQFSAQDGGLNLLVPQIDLLTGAFAYSLAPGGSVSSGPILKSGTSSDVYTAAAVLAEFTGLGNFSLTASTFTQTLLANTGGNTAASQITSAALTGSVTYTYNPVPEPATFALAGMAAVGMLLCVRRRRAS